MDFMMMMISEVFLLINFVLWIEKKKRDAYPGISLSVILDLFAWIRIGLSARKGEICHDM